MVQKYTNYSFVGGKEGVKMLIGWGLGCFYGISQHTPYPNTKKKKGRNMNDVLTHNNILSIFA